VDFYNDKTNKKIGLYNKGTIETSNLTYRSLTSRRLSYQTRVQDFNERNQDINQFLLAIFTYIQAFTQRNQESCRRNQENG
jgi:hypothetical protein